MSQTRVRKQQGARHKLRLLHHQQKAVGDNALDATNARNADVEYAMARAPLA